jgi:toxin ParE2
LTVRFLVEAERELDEAVAFYEFQRPGLGTEFAAAVRQGLTHIAQFPEGWHPLTPHIRRYRLVRFPYGLIYAPLPEEILIVAVMHLHRRPGYWVNRLSDNV